MNTLDQFTEEQRKIIVAEIVKHEDEAYLKGLEVGKAEAGPAAVAAWLRKAKDSWTMWLGTGAISVGFLADAWPLAAELLSGRVDPETLRYIGLAIVATRSRSIGK